MSFEVITLSGNIFCIDQDDETGFVLKATTQNIYKNYIGKSFTDIFSITPNYGVKGDYVYDLMKGYPMLLSNGSGDFIMSDSVVKVIEMDGGIELLSAKWLHKF